MIEKSRLAKETTRNLINTRYVTSRDALQEKYNIREEDYYNSLSTVFHSYIKPFRNTFASLNAGVLTIYEIFHKDHIATLDDLKLFIIFLEIYGTGRAIKPDGEYVSLLQRRKNSVKKIDLIIAELITLSKTEIEIEGKHAELMKEINQLSSEIIKGFKTIKAYLESKLGKGDIENAEQKPPRRANAINCDSDEESAVDKEKGSSQRGMNQNINLGSGLGS